LAGSYNNIGLVYDNMGEYSKALSYYEKAQQIFEKSLPPTHPNIGVVKSHIENVKKKL
jgi:tetratricopeptide (TPR) repeat protein